MSAPIPSLSWTDGFLHVDMPGLPGGPLELLYLEAYCRRGAHDRDWGETVIPHRTEWTRARRDGSALWLRDVLDDGVIVKHAITATPGGVNFRVEAHNPTSRISELDWAQPCLRVGAFTGHMGSPDLDAYLPQCFIFMDGASAFLPTQPWETRARYTPGQVWRGPGIAPDDVNPRPLNPRTPDNHLIGCLSADGAWLAAVAWTPCHELFQGIYHCIHADFHVGGLAPGQTRRARGRLYLMEADISRLLSRYRADFG